MRLHVYRKSIASFSPSNADNYSSFKDFFTRAYEAGPLPILDGEDLSQHST